MTRPRDYDELVAAVRVIAEEYGATPYERVECVFFVDRLRALLPPAKERVPWWEAKGRTVDGLTIEQVGDHVRLGATYFRETAEGGAVKFDVDPDGMVEVDAR